MLVVTVSEVELARIVKQCGTMSKSRGDVSSDVMQERGGLFSEIALMNGCSLSFPASALTITPSPLLLTVPVMPKREAKL